MLLEIQVLHEFKQSVEQNVYSISAQTITNGRPKLIRLEIAFFRSNRQRGKNSYRKYFSTLIIKILLV